MAAITNRNGVDVDRLVGTVAAVQADPNVAKFTFRACSAWESGGRNKGEIREFEHAGATTKERPQAVVPAHQWQAAQSLGDWTLVGCTVAPGFEFAGFELAPPDWKPG